MIHIDLIDITDIIDLMSLLRCCALLLEFNYCCFCSVIQFVLCSATLCVFLWPILYSIRLWAQITISLFELYRYVNIVNWKLMVVLLTLIRMAVAEDIGFKIEKLTAENYHNWKFQMKMYLIGKDLWEIVTGTEVLDEDASAEEQRKFKKRENQALACVCLSVATNLQIYVRSANNAKEAWDNLSGHFEEKSLSKKIFYRRKLYSARMEKGTNMVTHINYVKTLSEHLESVDDPIAEKDLVIILISSLPDEYNYLITALETIAEEKLTWNYVRDRLIHEFDKIQNGKGERDNPATQEALISSRGTELKKTHDLKKIKCHYCKRKGHFARDCFKRKADQRRPSNAEFANKAEGVSMKYPAVALASGGASMKSDEWWIDSGASQHMTPDKKGMVEYKSFKSPVKVKLADNSTLYAYGKGSVALLAYDGTRQVSVTLHDVLYVPRIQNKLLSLPTVTEKGAEVQFKGQFCRIIIDDKSYTIGHKYGKLYKLNSEPVQTSYFGSTAGGNRSQSIWHYRLGHLGANNMKKMLKEGLVDGMDCSMAELENEQVCQGCLMGKQHRNPFPKASATRAAEVMTTIHSDVCGPINVESLGKSKYFVTFIDDMSRYTHVYFLKHKSEVLEKFKEFVNLTTNETGNQVKILRTDNGGEYCSHEFAEYMKEKGILHQTTTPMNPEQNGIAERMNRTIVETARSMLHHAKLPTSFWAEAVSTAVYLRNRSPTVALSKKTPFECWYNVMPNLSNLRVFGCIANVHIADKSRRKFDAKSKQAIFVGYPHGTKGYKLYDLQAKQFIRSRDVIFSERDFHDFDRTVSSKSDYIQVDFDDEIDPEFDRDTVDKAANLEVEKNVLPVGATYEQNFMREVANLQGARLRTHHAKLADQIDEENANCFNADIIADEIEEPTKIYDAWTGEHANEWKVATDAEYASLIKNKTWDLVPLPKEKNVISCKWVFKVKRKANGSVDRYKARLVAQGFSQEEGEDYDDTFAPVARYSSIRLILAVANQLNLEVHQMDVKTAYLNGDLEHEIYMKQPEGYADEDQKDLVCRLRKSLYGLKQSARCWNITIDSFLKESGYVQSNADPCVYFKAENKDGKKERLMIIALYVDDIVLATNDTTMLEKEKSLLKERFEMEDRGEIHYCLGMSITRDRASKILKINQRAFLENVLKRFKMFECKPVSTPIEVGKRFEKLKDGENTTSQKEYQAAIGSLTYAAIATRPDISYAVGVLSQFMSCPGQVHFQGVKRILRYLKGTLHYGLKFEAKDEADISIQGFADADWAGDVSTRKSTSGYIFQLGNATVSWKAKKQTIVALSSTEAEYVSSCLAAQETIWLRNLLTSIGYKQLHPTTIYEDNQGAIALSKNAKSHPRTKHIDIKYHYVRDATEKGHLQLEYCPSEIMLADVFTKALPKTRFEELRTLLGVQDCH